MFREVPLISAQGADRRAVTVAEALVASMVLAVAGLSLLSSQVAGVERLRRDATREAVESVMNAVLWRFQRSHDGVERFLGPVPGDPSRLRGGQPWRWSPELTAGLDAAVLDAWARERELDIRVELVREDVPGLLALEVTAGWSEAGPGNTKRSLSRGHHLMAVHGR